MKFSKLRNTIKGNYLLLRKQDFSLKMTPVEKGGRNEYGSVATPNQVGAPVAQ